MQLEYTWSRIESLTAVQLYEIIQAREAVFVVEQDCPYQESDGRDLHAWHLCVRTGGELAAYARVVEPGFKYAEPSIGRVMTVARFRQLKIGRALMQEAIAFTEGKYPGQAIRIGAQLRLQAFYESLGFVAASEPYGEDGIPHLEMVRGGPPSGNPG